MKMRISLYLGIIFCLYFYNLWLLVTMDKSRRFPINKIKEIMIIKRIFACMHHSYIILHFIDLKPTNSSSLGLLSDEPQPSKLITRHLSSNRSMSQITMEELWRNQEALKVEVKQLETLMSLIMEILQSMMRKEGNFIPTIVPEVVTSVNMPNPTPHQEHPRGFHPQPGPPKAPY